MNRVYRRHYALNNGREELSSLSALEAGPDAMGDIRSTLASDEIQEPQVSVLPFYDRK